MRRITCLILWAGCGLLYAVGGCSAKQHDQPLSLARAGFALQVLPESLFEPATRAEFELDVAEADGAIEAVLRVREAVALKAVYFTLSYDTRRYSPVAAEAGPVLRDTAEQGELLELAVLDQPGAVSHGQVLPHWDRQPGFNGEGVVATVRFAARPWAGAHRASTPPNTLLSACPLALSGPVLHLSWHYYNQGDYNQDGLVGLTDLTQLGLRYGQAVDYPLQQNTYAAVTDGNGDGVLNVGDLAPLGINFGKDLRGGYHVYASTNAADYPADWHDNNGGAAYLGAVAFDDYAPMPSPPTDRHLYTLDIGAHIIGRAYWVRPVDADGVEGIASNFYLPGTTNFPPQIIEIIYGVDPVGSDSLSYIRVWSVDPDGDEVTTTGTATAGLVFAAGEDNIGVMFHAPEVSVDTAVDLTLTVSDGRGGEASAPFRINVTAPVAGNAAPVIESVYCTPYPIPSGEPATIFCQASDPDGDTLRYSYSVMAPLGRISGGSDHAYYNAPDVTTEELAALLVCVDDGHGHVDYDASITLRVVPPGANHPPEARFTTRGGTGDGLAGIARHYVQFDASTSTDEDGDPLHFDWELGDGSTDTGTVVDNIYATPGVYPVRVFAYDGQFTATCQAKAILVVSPGSWHVMTLDATEDAGKYCNLAEVNGLPQIVYQIETPSGNGLICASSGSPTGLPGTWHIGTPFPANPVSISLAEVAGQPAIAFCDMQSGEKQLMYTRYNGAYWPDPWLLDGADACGEGCQLVVTGGFPRVCYFRDIPGPNRYLRCISATDADGGAWAPPYQLGLADAGTGTRAGALAYTPVAGGDEATGIAFLTLGALCFARSSTPAHDGFFISLAYDIPVDLLGGYPAAVSCLDRLTVLYRSTGIVPNRLLALSANSLAVDWTAPEALATDCAGPLSLALVDGQPAVAYRGVQGELFYLRDGTCGEWNGTEACLVDAGGGGDVGAYCSLAEVGGHPAIAYYDETNGDLKFAIRY